MQGLLVVASHPGFLRKTPFLRLFLLDAVRRILLDMIL